MKLITNLDREDTADRSVSHLPGGKTMQNHSSSSIALKYQPEGLEQTAHRLPSKKTSSKRVEPILLKVMRPGFRVLGRLVPGLAGYFAYRLWFTPTRFGTPSSEMQALEAADIKSIAIHDRDIMTYKWGSGGPKVLLVHGWSGRGTQMGRFVPPLLGAGYQVLSFDLPAHGKSSGKQTNIYQVVDTLIALQKIAGPFEAVITHSFGGPCMGVALQRGFETRCMVSIAPPSNTRRLIERFAELLHLPLSAKNNLMQRFEAQFGPSIWEDVSMEIMVRDIKLPGLLIHDEHDRDIPWQDGRDVARAWSQSRFIKTAGLGHRRVLREPAVIDAAVAFIQAGANLVDSAENDQ